MALPFFYEPLLSSTEKSFTLGEEASRHCIQVLRMKEGEQMGLTDGKGNLFTASIIKVDKKKCEVAIQQTSFKEQAARKVCMAISLLKNANRFEWFLEKAAEIGISEVMPLLCARTERSHFRYDRMNSILISAMLQSQQAWLPLLHQPVKFEEAVQQTYYQQKLIAHCENGTKHAISNLSLTNSIQLLIGPEGDFTTGEIEKAIAADFIPVSLGNTRLRTETAGITASVLLMHL